MRTASRLGEAGEKEAEVKWFLSPEGTNFLLNNRVNLKVGDAQCAGKFLLLLWDVIQLTMNK